MVISGFIRDIQTDKPIAQASIFEKNLYVSTLTNRNGFFELNIRNPENSVWLSMSKDNYRDTSMFLLIPVDALGRQKKRKLRYYSSWGNKSSVDSAMFLNWLYYVDRSSPRFDTTEFVSYRPYQLSLTPGLSTNDLFEQPGVNKVSLNVFGGYTTGVDGFEIAGLFNVNRFNVRRFQAATLVNSVGGSLQGLQIAGVLNKVDREVEGLQISGAINYARHLKSGLQIAGTGNVTYGGNGSQIAGILNYNDGMVRSQLSVFINYARKVKGVQIAGLVNVSDSSDYPIGILNFIKNGEKSLMSIVDESGFFQVAFRSGGRKTYSVLGLAYNPTNASRQIGLEVGLGYNYWRLQRLVFSVELASYSMWDSQYKSAGDRSILRLPIQYFLSKHCFVYAGASLQFNQLPEEQRRDKQLSWRWFAYDKNRNGFYAGLAAGLGFKF